MRLFESEQVIDLDPYIVVLDIRVWVLNSIEMSMKHTPHWYLKDPPLPRPEDISLVDASVETIVPYPSPPVPTVETSRVSLDDNMVDLNSYTD